MKINAINFKKLEKQIIKEVFWSVIYIEMLSHMAASLSDLINGIIIGNAISSAALAGLGLCAPIGRAIIALSMLVGSGAKIVCGYFMGRGEEENVRATFTTAVVTAVAIGAALMMVVLIGAEPIAIAFGATDETLAFTAQYLRGYAFAFIPLIISPTLIAFLMMGNKSGHALIASLIQAGTNLLFGLAAVKLLSGTMFEIGIASALGVWMSVAFMAISLSKNKKIATFDLKSFKFSIAKNIASKGVTVFLMTLFSGIRTLLINKQLVIYGGTSAVAAMTILQSTLLVQDAALMGGANVISMHFSVAVGEKDIDRMKNVFSYEATMNIVLMIVLGIIMVASSSGIAKLFGADEATTKLTQMALAEYHFGQIFFGVMYMFIAAYQCLGHIKTATIMSVIATLPFPTLFIFLLPPIFGVAGVWGAFIGQGVFCLILNIIVIIINKKRWPKTMEDWLLLDDSYGAEKQMNISLDNIEDVCKVSQEIGTFLKENGIDERRSMMSGLCMEEMAANIVEHGFAKKIKGRGSIDIYAAVDKGEVIIRIRDNAPGFNPVDRLSVHQTDVNDPTKNVGIILVSKIAKEMNYSWTFGRNVLLIKI